MLFTTDPMLSGSSFLPVLLFCIEQGFDLYYPDSCFLKFFHVKRGQKITNQFARHIIKYRPAMIHLEKKSKCVKFFKRFLNNISTYITVLWFIMLCVNTTCYYKTLQIVVQIFLYIKHMVRNIFPIFKKRNVYYNT